MPGIFITRGMTITIPPGGLKLSIGEDGKPSSNLVLHLHVDVCPIWMQLALRHLRDAQAREVERMTAWQTDDNDEAKALALEREFESSMQAIMASAIAVDALYATLRDKIDVPETQLTKWRKNRTARHAQVAEVVKLAFGLKERSFHTLRKILAEIYRVRDLAVHPSGKVQAPALHPELDVGVEWRFAFFRCRSAELVVGVTAQMLAELVNQGRPRNENVKTYAEGLRARLQELR